MKKLLEILSIEIIPARYHFTVYLIIAGLFFVIAKLIFKG